MSADSRITSTAWLGLGSNLGNSCQTLHQAIDALQASSHTSIEAISPFYRSRAIGPQQPDFINAVIRVATSLTPIALLDTCQQLEQEAGRKRLQYWGPRTLDVDILLYGNLTLASSRLTVPHPFLTERNFVLQPLYDIDPELQLPDGSRLEDHLANCPPNPLARLETKT